jgi:hypothetical protein
MGFRLTAFRGIGLSLYLVKLLVVFLKEIVKTLTKVITGSDDYNSKTAIMQGIKQKYQMKA